MSAKVVFGAAFAAAVSLVQLAPAPPVGALPFLSVALQGAVAGTTTVIHECSGGACTRKVRARDIESRQSEAPAGVPQFEWDRCIENIDGVEIIIRGFDDGLEISGLPATCMNLANVLISEANEGPFPIVCGSDCLVYEGLSPEEFSEAWATVEELFG